MTLGEYIVHFLKNKKYMFCLTLTMIFAYGFYFSYTSLNVDDTAMGRWCTVGRTLQIGRWGMYLRKR